MAGILQLRRGLKSTYISEGTNLAEAFFVTTFESGSVSANTLIVGVSGSTGNDVVTLAKLSLANKDNTYADYNSGSFWITGDYTGSNALILKNLIVSGSTFVEGDLHLEGHLFLGSGSDDDVVRVQSEFSGSIIPDNDITGSVVATATTAYYDLGADAKRYRNIYLQKDVASGSNGGFISASHIDLTGNLVADNLGRFGTLVVDDLTDNRIMLVGPNGQVEDDANLTYDGQDFRLTNSDYYQIGSGATFQFDGAGMDITGSISNYQLRVNNGIVFTNELGTLDNQSQFTWDGGTLYVDGNISGSGTLEIDGQSTLASLKVEDLDNDEIVIAGVGGELETDQYFRYTGNEFIIGATEQFKVTTLNGNTSISGSVQMHNTLNVDGQSTLASVNVEDLIDNRVVIVGAGGELEDDGNFTFNGTELNIGTGNFTVQQGSGNTQILGTLDVDSQTTLSSLNVEDLTNNEIVLAGVGGEIEGDPNFTFDGTELNIGTGNFTVQQASGNTQILGTLNVDSQSTLSSLNVEDLTSGRVVLAGTSGEIEDSENLTFDGSTLTVTGDAIVTGNLTIQGTQTQLNTATLNVEDINILIASGAIDASAANGAGITIDGADATILYGSSDDSITINKQLKINGNISGSSFGGTTLLSSSNENFADYSQSVDSRLDYLEGPFSTSVDSRLDDAESTGSNHEQRIDSIESISGSLLYSASNDFSEITLNRIDGTTLEVNATPRKVIESVINKNGFMAKGTPVYVSGSTGNALHVFAASASRADRMPATFILDQDLNSDEEGYGILGGFINGVDTSLFEEGDNVYVGANGGYTNSRPTGSNIQVQKLGNVIKKAVNGSGVISGAGRSNDVPNIQEGYLWVGNGDDVATQYTTSSLIPQGTVSGSDQVTSSLDSRYVQSGSITGSNVVGSNSVTSIETMTSAAYSAITPVSGTLYIIVD